MGIGKKLVVFPQFDPRVEAETIAPHAVLVGGLAGTVDHIQIIVIERGIESDAGKATGAVGDVGIEAGGVAISHVDGFSILDHTAEEIAIDHVGEGTLLVDIAGIVGFEAHASKLVEILVPLCFNTVGIGGHQIGVAGVVVFEIVANIGAQVVSAGLRGAVGIAEAEVVHVFGVVAQMQRGGESEKGRVEVTGGVVIVNHTAGLIVGAQAHFDRKIAETAQIGHIGREVLAATDIVGTQIVTQHPTAAVLMDVEGVIDVERAAAAEVYTQTSLQFVGIVAGFFVEVAKGKGIVGLDAVGNHIAFVAIEVGDVFGRLPAVAAAVIRETVAEPAVGVVGDGEFVSGAVVELVGIVCPTVVAAAWGGRPVVPRVRGVVIVEEGAAAVLPLGARGAVVAVLLIPVGVGSKKGRERVALVDGVAQVAAQVGVDGVVIAPRGIAFTT